MRTTLLLFLILLPLFADTLPTKVEQIIANAHSQTEITRYYDPSYQKLDYPNGDVPLERGVCTDVIIRSFRAADCDLQQLVHEDMKKHFSLYPKRWGLKRTDKNIDHRRVPNLQTFFKRQHRSLPISEEGKSYLPGDVVTWKLDNGLDHIGLVVDIPVEGTDRYYVIHNIGAGAELEDMLFQYIITGHYRYFKE